MRQKSGRAVARVMMVWLSVFILAPLAVGAEPATLKYANFLPEATFGAEQMEKWKAEVERRTHGDISVSTFPGGNLLGAMEIIDGVVSGKADIGCFTMSYFPERFVITNAVSLPLAIPSAEVGSLVLWDLFQKYKPEPFANVKVLTMFTTAPANIMSTKPVRSVNDIQGMSLRSPGSGGPILHSWGAEMKAMPISEAPEALKKNFVQGVFTSLDFMKDFNFAEYCHFVTMTNTVIYPLAVVMNLDRWNSLPKAVQNVLEDLGAEHAAWAGMNWDQRVKDALEWSKEEYQVEVTDLAEAQKTKFNFLISPITSKWIKETKAKGLPAGAIVMDIRKLIRKHSM
ncbi:MAG: C4-dicarboxylate ABC transporter substrate-binding protein [Desulfobacteraceae bacterium 4572_88]|nr:MAG: C4-dicarboxylate ABC transporter substrate-binding protein [Desulfobacteraceae bacterium 4572_88]